MKLVDYLQPERILPAIHASRKEDAIAELSVNLAEAVEGVSRQDILAALIDRERLGSTALGEGVAVPHGKLAPLAEPVACLGRSRRGIDFDSPDGRPTHFFLAVISPANAAGGHLKLLARFSQVFKDAEFRGRLMAAKTADDMRRLLVEEEAE